MKCFVLTVHNRQGFPQGCGVAGQGKKIASYGCLEACQDVKAQRKKRKRKKKKKKKKKKKGLMINPPLNVNCDYLTFSLWWEQSLMLALLLAVHWQSCVVLSWVCWPIRGSIYDCLSAKVEGVERKQLVEKCSCFRPGVHHHASIRIVKNIKMYTLSKL